MTSLLEQGRTHTCGALRDTDAGTQVTLFGWVNARRDLGGRVFIDLRDRAGITQIMFGPDIAAPAHEAAHALRSEYCIGIVGKVVRRDDATINAKMPTGAIEVQVHTLEVFSASDTPPLSISDDERLDTNEVVRLRHRYLDLRRPSLQRNFIARAKMTSCIRNYMTGEGFLELETPFMVKYTPGGARNFLVPSRLNPGTFYALAESPQIFKQLFMVSGLERYFQIVRCFRDEDLRNDRQPEFTQVDIELSFATPERVFDLIEGLIVSVWRDILDVELARPFPRLTWEDAMGRWGSDKPDLRFGLEFFDITEATRNCGFSVFEHAAWVKGICVPPEHASALNRSRLDKLTEFVKKREHGGAKGLAWAVIEADGTYKCPWAKNIDAAALAAITARSRAVPGSVLLIIADDFETTHATLGALRLELRDALQLLPSDPPWRFCWVTDFPMFERTDRGWVAAHHPFTSPREEHLSLLTSDPGRVRAKAYDLVLDGNEIGGGSIRIHRSDVQAQVFSALGLSEEDAQRKFGFLLEAFRYGPPPHGGIALGLDRLAMLVCRASSLRDVIAFPKTQRGQDLMTECPTPVSDEQLAELYLRHRALPGEGEAKA